MGSVNLGQLEMIITKTFKRGMRGIELRVYVPAMMATLIEQYTEAARQEIEKSKVFKPNTAIESMLTLSSNRVGMHFACVVPCRYFNTPPADTDNGRLPSLDEVADKLLAAGWKESKGN